MSAVRPASRQRAQRRAVRLRGASWQRAARGHPRRRWPSATAFPPPSGRQGLTNIKGGGQSGQVASTLDPTLT
eukprot:3628277-Pyramimonas_sp.AAC.1